MSITAVGWIVWFLLFRPIVVILLWFIGVRIFYHHIIRLGGLQGIVTSLKVYGWIIILVLVVERAWNLYNILKFRGKERRRTSEEVTKGELGDFLHLPAKGINTLHESENISIDFPGAGMMKFQCDLPKGSEQLNGVLSRPEQPGQ